MKIYEGESVPKLENPKCSVVQCDVNTGIVLTLDGQRKIDEKSFILIFDSFTPANEFAKARFLENSEVECSIYNYRGEYITANDIR